jgi:hypothetical protein
MTPYISTHCNKGNLIITDDEVVSLWTPSPAELQCLIAGGSLGVKISKAEQEVFTLMPDDKSYYTQAKSPEHAMELLPISMRHSSDLTNIIKKALVFLAEKLPNEERTTLILNEFLDLTAQPNIITTHE